MLPLQHKKSKCTLNAITHYTGSVLYRIWQHLFRFICMGIPINQYSTTRIFVVRLFPQLDGFPQHLFSILDQWNLVVFCASIHWKSLWDTLPYMNTWQEQNIAAVIQGQAIGFAAQQLSAIGSECLKGKLYLSHSQWNSWWLMGCCLNEILFINTKEEAVVKDWKLWLLRGKCFPLWDPTTRN